MRLSKFRLLVASTLLGLTAASQVIAAPITRAGFSASASNYVFSAADNGATTVTDGFMTVSGGLVAVLGAPPFDYYDGGDAATPIRLDFASGVSAVGMDWVSNNQDTTLSLFDSSNGLLEFLTIPAAGAATCFSSPCGFIGIDFGSNAVSYAVIDTPLAGNELYIANIVYQQAVPEPATLLLVGLGLIGAAASRRRRG